MKVLRSPHNPIIEPKDVKPSRQDFEVISVFNPAVARLADEVILLLRVAERPVATNPNLALVPVYDVSKGDILNKEFSKDDPDNDFSDPRFVIRAGQRYLSSISHLRVARSKDGITFNIHDRPALSPENEYETFGIEDARITPYNATYYIDYVGVCPNGVTTCLASTTDFESFKRHGIIFCPDNKDVVIFPCTINGKFYALHRPTSAVFGKHEIWLAESPDLISWGNHRRLVGPRADAWDTGKIGAGAVPFRIEAGWLEIYHGVNSENRYCLGAVLLDAKQPWRILARSTTPVFEPQADYELNGLFPNVVFTCGLLYEQQKLKIYYGAADTSVCYVELTLQHVLDTLNL